jgi:tryptophanyl-tRNA synthetase
MLAQIASIQLFWAAEDSQEYVEQINVISLVYWGVMVMCSTYSCTLHMNRYVVHDISVPLLLTGDVPVGLDQEQHLELSRKLARRFNQGFGVLFPEPEPLFSESPKIMSLADPDRKMSKSLGARHYIGLFKDAQSIRSKVRAAVTDCGILPTETELSPGVANLVQILKACGKQAEASAFLQDYQAGRRQYSELKEAVAAALVELTTGLRAKREGVRCNAAKVKAQIREMSEMARKIAGKTLREVRARVGLPERT